MSIHFIFTHVYSIGDPINFEIYCTLQLGGYKVDYRINGFDNIKITEKQKMLYMIDGGVIKDPGFCKAGDLIVCKIVLDHGQCALEIQDLLHRILQHKLDFNYETQKYCNKK